MKQIILILINPFTVITFLFFCGLVSSRVKRKIKFYFYGLLFFIISSSPITSTILSYPLINAVETLNDENSNDIHSIIVLTAGIQKNIVGEWMPSINSINRTLLGKSYSEKLYVPLVISGGPTSSEASSEALIIKNYFSLEDSILDQNSKNTYESAKGLSNYCKTEKGPLLLITGEYHRLRSYLSFKSQNCEVLLLKKETCEHCLTGKRMELMNWNSPNKKAMVPAWKNTLNPSRP